MTRIKQELYAKAFTNTLKAYMSDEEQDVKPFIKKMIYYGVKTVNTMNDRKATTLEDAERDFKYAEIIKTFMGPLTPEEFVNIFPITKDYKGNRYETKDYFYTRDYIKGLDQDKPIGEGITSFLWEYTNWDIKMFTVNTMSFLSNLRRLNGDPGLMEEWADKMGLKTYTMCTDHKGKQFLYDKETGKTTKVRKPKPRYLKLIK